MRSPRPLLSLVLLAALTFASVARADVRALRLDLKLDAAVTAGAALLQLGLNAGQLSPDACRICSGGTIDNSVRDALRWPTEAGDRARRASDLLMGIIIPVGALTNSALSARSAGVPFAAVEDMVIELQAVMLAADLTGIVKIATARRRPAGDRTSMPGSRNRSFYSGHTSIAFSFAAAAGMVSTLRGYRSAPWVWAIGMVLASGVGYLRIAGDAHWLSDVVVGAAVSGALGAAVPYLFHRVRTKRLAGLEFGPAPNGLAIHF